MLLAEEKPWNAKLLGLAKKWNEEESKRRFGNKLSVIEDLRFGLMHCSKFPQEIEGLRVKHDIRSGLEWASDNFWTKKDKAIMPRTPSGSLFWAQRGLEKEESFDKDLKQLISSYEHVPSSLFRWAKSFAMYRVVSGWEPERGLGFLTHLLQNREDISKLALTEEEQDTLTEIARVVLGKKLGRSGRPKKGTEEMYAAVLKVVTSSGKSEFHISSSSTVAREIFLQREKGLSYRDIVKKLYPEAPSIEVKMKWANRKDFDFRRKMAALTKKKKVGK